ncbi:O-antigen ligase [Maribacter sedimenticola]|uniref:O-antigen ligase n=1 Tax=Maribacter sedimenticola TaxID=228956 RepID=A0ABY1SCT0_9FLAO|nr:O-antigen ligase family protein [Maribacter sedimenticola]SNR24566.1 O-antigen ligase [Maribacter sedimenticola]
MRINVKTSLFFSLFLFFLPFTQALTLNIGFALKISEVIILFLIFLYLNKIKAYVFISKLPISNVVLSGFMFLAILSFIINSFWDYTYNLKEIPFRINAIGDSFLRLFYIFICYSTYFISKKFISRNPEVLKYWVQGAVIVALYSWYLFISSALEIPYLKLPGMLDSPQTLYGIVRSGTFLEGNFFGLYLILSSAVAFFLDKNKSGKFLLLSVFTTLSSISIISSLFFVIIYYRTVIFKKNNFKYFIGVLPFIFIGMYFFVQTSFYQDYVYKKIATPSTTLTTYNLSKVDRLLTSRIAFKLGIDNPIVGVGPYNYSLHYDEYNDIEDEVENLKSSEFAISYFARKNTRAIPNNIYLEVWSEYGIIGFLLYCSFLLILIYKSYKLRKSSIFAGVVALLISFCAFPSFIMVFIWSYFAIPFALDSNYDSILNK